MPTKTWVVGEECLAADFNTYVQNQVVPTFPNAAAMSAWSSPPDGALAVTTDNGAVYRRSAGTWKGLAFGALWDFQQTAVAESGDLGPTVTNVITSPSLTFVGGRTYRLAAGVMFIFRTGAAGISGAEMVLDCAGMPRVAKTIQLPAANIGMVLETSQEFRVTTTASGTARMGVRQVGWSANPIRYAIGAEQPMWLNVTDLGIR